MLSKGKLYGVRSASQEEKVPPYAHTSPLPLNFIRSQFEGGEECRNAEIKWLLLSVFTHLKLSSQLVKSQNAFLKEGNKIGSLFPAVFKDSVTGYQEAQDP